MVFRFRHSQALTLIGLFGGIFSQLALASGVPAMAAPAATALATESAQAAKTASDREAATADNQPNDPAGAVQAPSAPTPTVDPVVEMVPVKAKYSAKLEKGVPFRGSATRSLKQRDDGLWEYHFDVDSFIADIRESVVLKWDGRQVIPISYRYSLEGLMISNRSAELDFDWDRMRVRNDVKDQPWYMDVHQGVLDKLGFQLQLRQDLKAGKTEMVYEIADGGKLKEYEFKVVEETMIDTQNHGRVNALLVEKVREPYKKRETHLWFAPQWDYLLVRMVQIEDDGTRYEINLEEARLPGKRID